MRSGADYIFSIFQNHNCPPGAIFLVEFIFFLLKSGTVSHFSIAIMSFDTEQNANCSGERTFSQAAILSWRFPDSVGTAEDGVHRGFLYPRRFLTDQQPLLPLCGQGNQSEISQGLHNKAGN